jgi:lysylphosphatidylglycerol synthetase-like protein (DUF2156 family)
LVSLGGVHAAPQLRAALLDRFLDEARRRRLRVIAAQVRADQAELFRARGFTVNPFGSTYALRLDGFSYAGTRRMKVRQKVRQARKMGLRVLEVGRDVPADWATWDRLRAVSAAWLAGKRKKELDFMVGELGEPGDTERRVFLATDAGGRALGFITYVPAWGRRPGYLHDLTRRPPDAPPGVMEFCNAHAIERFAAEGAEYLHFGFTPFAVDGAPPGDSRLLTWLLGLLWRRGAVVYPAQRQVAYKLKWAPDVIETEHIACRPLSPRAVLDFLFLTRSL